MPADLPQMRRETLADNVYDAIRAVIVDHGTEPGERLGIADLARRLGVSQTPVREALSRLAAEGLATYAALVGYRVSAPLDEVGFDRLMEARFVIEPQLAALAAKRSADVDGDVLLRLGDVDVGVSGDDPYERFRHHTARDASFHAAIATIADNQFLADALESMRAHMHLYRLHDPRALVDITYAEHVEVVNAIVAGDIDGAAEAMRLHLEGSYQRHSAGLQSGAADARSNEAT